MLNLMQIAVRLAEMAEIERLDDDPMTRAKPEFIDRLETLSEEIKNLDADMGNDLLKRVAE